MRADNAILPSVGAWSRWCLTMLVIAVLAGCAGLLGPRTVEVPLQRLQASVDRKFPINQRLFELINLKLSDPKVALLADSNRVRVTMDASVAPIFTSRVWRGNFTLSGRLQIDPARRAVLLTEPQFENIVLDGIDPTVSAQVARGADTLAAQILRDTPLYTFAADDFRYGGTRFVPTNIVTNATGLVVTFAPAN